MKAMDGRSISSRYDFSESENGSIHSGQGRTARTVSFARRYVSTVSLFSLRRKDSLRKRGNGVRSAASELFLREKSDVNVEWRPKTSYLFSLGKERDGLAEIIPQTLVSDDDYESKHDGLKKVRPASPIYPNDVEDTRTDGGVSYDQWRYSALLPLPRARHFAERPGTCGSSVYSQDLRGLGKVNESHSSVHSQESGRPETVLPGQRLLRTRSLLSLAKRYSSHDEESFIYSHDEPEASQVIPAMQNASLPEDDWSIYSREESSEPVHGLRGTRAGTIDSSISPLTPTRGSCDLTSLPPLPTEQGRPTWHMPSPVDELARETTSGIWWRQSSTYPQKLSGKPSVSNGEHPLHYNTRDATIWRRPSSWSWLTINTIRSDRTSSSGARKSSEGSILEGQRYIRAPVRASTESNSSSAARTSETLTCSPSMDGGVYKGHHRMSAGIRPVVRSLSEMPDFFQIDWKTPKRDLLRLPPLQLPELPDEQRVSFYARCGHFETDPDLVIIGRELQGSCPECSKGRRSKRKVVKKELRSILKSIAE